MIYINEWINQIIEKNHKKTCEFYHDAISFLHWINNNEIAREN